MSKITLSAIKADIGSIGGHTKPSDELFNTLKNFILEKGKNMLVDFYVGYTGDDIHLLLSHRKGINNEEIHKLAWDAFKAGTEIAKKAGEKGIKTCVFDRNGYLYHGRVKALADAAREGGLQF